MLIEKTWRENSFVSENREKGGEEKEISRFLSRNLEVILNDLIWIPNEAPRRPRKIWVVNYSDLEKTNRKMVRKTEDKSTLLTYSKPIFPSQIGESILKLLH